MRQTLIITFFALGACGGQSNVTPPPKETPTTSGSSSAAAPVSKGPPRAVAAPDVAELGKLLRAEGGLKHVNARIVDESCPKKIWDKKKGTSPVGVEELHDGPDTYASLSGTSEDSSRDQLLAWSELVPEDRFLGIYAPSLAGQKFWTGICVERDKMLEAGVHFDRIRKKDKSLVEKDVPIEFLPKMAVVSGAGGDSLSTGTCNQLVPGRNPNDSAIGFWAQPPGPIVQNTTIRDSAGFGIMMSYDGSQVPMLDTNTFTNVAGCFQSWPADSNHTCPKDPPCPR